MDVAVLVVSGADGIMPQTREHLLLAKQIGVKQIVVFINFVDVLRAQKDSDTLELVELEVRELLDYFGFDSKKIPIIKGIFRFFQQIFFCSLEKSNG